MSAPSDWWKTFFGGVVLDMWNRALPPEWTRSEADFIEAELAVPQGASILDVPCGNGRLSLELARRGYVVTGVDIAGDNIRDAKSHDVPGTWVQGDMRELPWPGAFDAAF